ncbi:BON domain-containing protein [Silvimonas iriomotensis]|uniref:BON domain-containing protein n=1 Tax=Silvimonas iriomotensis TaxID=449662 RepID=UPI001665DEF3|nr:BON domain-containing protein [Silvimonas iriomotensis]
MLINKKLLAAAGAAVLIGLQGCVPLVFAGGAALGVLIGTDPRPSETIKTDVDLGNRIGANINDTWKDQAHVNVNIFNGVVLLTGEVPNADAHNRVQQIAQSQPGVRRVVNATVVGPVSSTTDRLNDTQLTTRVKTSIVSQSGMDSSGLHLVVITERKVVYLMGIAKPDVADRAAQAASVVSGVEQVVKVVETQPAGPADRN